MAQGNGQNHAFGCFEVRCFGFWEVLVDFQRHGCIFVVQVADGSHVSIAFWGN